MKNLIYSSFAILLLGITTPIVNATAYYTNYNNIEMTEQQYNNLVQLGFNENEIYQMGREEFEANKNIEGTLVSENESYYKTTTVTQNGITTSNSEIITKEEYQMEKNSNTPQIRSGYDGIVTTEYKQMRTSMTEIDQYQYRYKVTLTWLNMPSKRSYDIIGLGFEQAIVQLNSSINFQQNYTFSSGSSYSSVVCVPQQFDTGISAVFLLPSGSLNALSSYLYYNVRKVDDDYTVTYMEAGGDYSHATSSISETNAQRHSVNHVTGIELDSAIDDKYDSINVARAIWYGEW